MDIFGDKMKLFIVSVICCFVVVVALPNIRIERISEEFNEINNAEKDIFNEFHYSEPKAQAKRPYGSISEILEDGIFSGGNYLEKSVPPIENMTIGSIGEGALNVIDSSEDPTGKPEKLTDDQRYRIERDPNIPEDTTVILIPVTTVMPSTYPTKKNVNIEHVLKQINEAIKQIIRDSNPQLLLPIIKTPQRNTTQFLTEQMTNILNLLRSQSDETTPNELIGNVTNALDDVLTKIKKRSSEIVMPRGNIYKYTLIENGTAVKEDPKRGINTTQLIMRIKEEMQEIKADVMKRGAQLKKNGTKLTLGELVSKNSSSNIRYERQEGEEEEDDDAITESSLDNAVEDVSNGNGNGNGKGKGGKQSSSQQSEGQSSSSEEDQGFIGNLLSSFLGGLSKPDGGVDVEALVGLIGGLSVEQEDGSYNFDSLSEVLQGLIGGDENGGGSDVGAFLGGLLGALIKGFAIPPGPTGVGIFTGNLVSKILPALSGPAPGADEVDKDQGSGGFIKGLLSSMLGASSGSGANEGGGGGGSAGFFATIIGGLFSTIFSLISSLSGTLSAAKH